MTFSRSGDVEPRHVDRAREVFSRVLAHAREPVLSVRASLALMQAHTPPLRAEAMVRVNVNGRIIHAHAEAASLHEAISIAADRLGAQLARAGRDWESRRGQHPRPSHGLT
jgi:ribosome-associated translation inhibitor RaiA